MGQETPKFNAEVLSNLSLMLCKFGNFSNGYVLHIV